MKKFKVQKLVNGVPEESNKKYLVVNVDEPYAIEVFFLIREHEKQKGTWEGPEYFADFVKQI